MPSRESKVEVGRLVVVNYGKDNGKLGVILDVCDTMTCLVDGPKLKRGLVNFRRLAFTDIVIPVKRSMKTSTLNKAWEAADVDAQFKKTTWGQKLAQKEKRANLTDFDRFVVKTLKSKKNKLIAKKVKELKSKN
mmetsp:Transcript_1976/g.4515  ORF Transcript_1976/g.4515 Transcript_1976/m.4515 type:complete len:134 (+) Transcript_1976:76-477(+)